MPPLPFGRRSTATKEIYKRVIKKTVTMPSPRQEYHFLVYSRSLIAFCPFHRHGLTLVIERLETLDSLVGDFSAGYLIVVWRAIRGGGKPFGTLKWSVALNLRCLNVAAVLSPFSSLRSWRSSAGLFEPSEWKGFTMQEPIEVGFVNPILRPAFNFCFNGWGYRVGTARVLAFSVLAGRHIEVFRGIEMLKAARAP
jgi:hypothetical protein